MQFERLRKSHKKQIIIGALAVCVIGGALTFSLTKAKYEIANDLELAKGTINYKIPDLRVVALYIESDNGYVETSDIPSSGFGLNENKSICKVYDGTTSIEDAPKDNNVIIEYKNGKVDFLNISKKNTRCYLYFDIKNTKAISTILGKIEVNINKPDFSQVATSNEGIFEVQDELYGGTSYYWRGNVNNNWVKFGKWSNDTPDVYYGYHISTDDAYIEFKSLTECQNYEYWNRNCTFNSRAGKDMYWRIIRINGNGTIRMIYSGTNPRDSGPATSIFNNDFNPSNGAEYTGYKYTIGQALGKNLDSYAKKKLDEWYNTYLNQTGIKDYIVTSAYYCNDRSLYEGTGIGSDKTTKFSAYNRLIINKTPTLKCFNNEDLYQLPIGLITADEVALAGGSNSNANSSFYLYADVKYWTMTPADNGAFPSVMFLNKEGQLKNGDSVANGKAIRPVINLSSNIKISGSGTIDSPYIVE